MSDNNNLSEMNRRRGAMSHTQQPNSTRTKNDIKNKVAMVKAQPKPDLPQTTKEKIATRSRSLSSSSRNEIRSRAAGRGETPASPSPKKKGPRKNTRSDAPATAGPKDVLPKEGKSVVDHYVRIGRAIAEGLTAAEVRQRHSKNLKNIKRAEANMTKTGGVERIKQVGPKGTRARDKNDEMHKKAIDDIVKTGSTRPADQRNEEAAPAKVVNPDDQDERYVSKGRTGKASDPKRLLKAGTKKKTALASERVKDHTAGPKGQLPDHYLYAGIGVALAEGLGMFPVEEGSESPSAYASRTSPKGSGGSSDRGTRARTTFQKRQARIYKGMAQRQFGTSKSPNAPQGDSSTRNFRAMAQGQKAMAKLSGHKPTRTQSDKERATIIANRNKGIDSEKPK